MICGKMSRFLHTSNYIWQASNKSLLAKLRRKTGYTFANCKKALDMHENDIEKAESWLREQAQALGWSKAEKLQGRSTTQGLIAVIIDKSNAALVEINCETDFVARNKQFHGLAETVVTSVLKHSTSGSTQALESSPVSKILYNSEQIKAIQAPDGKPLADHSALTIGYVGENIGLRRALCLSVHPEVKLVGCTHPAPVNPVPISFGRYGSIVAYKCPKKHDTLGLQLCQHVIGMNPTKVGDPTVDLPNNNTDNETSMIYQEFLLDPTLTIQQVLQDNQAEILDFARFEMGEVIEQPQQLEHMETCG